MASLSLSGCMGRDLVDRRTHFIKVIVHEEYEEWILSGEFTASDLQWSNARSALIDRSPQGYLWLEVRLNNERWRRMEQAAAHLRTLHFVESAQIKPILMPPVNDYE